MRNLTSVLTNRPAEEEEVVVGIVMDGGAENIISIGGNVLGAAAVGRAIVVSFIDGKQEIQNLECKARTFTSKS
jgi:hypothetical protein